MLKPRSGCCEKKICLPDGLTGPRGCPGKNGPTGPTGRNGPTGPCGCDGEPGALGPTGVPGREGIQGKNGSRGPTGPTGIKGSGFTGPTGPIGIGRQGNIGPTGATGPIGPAFIPLSLQLNYRPFNKIILSETSLSPITFNTAIISNASFNGSSFITPFAGTFNIMITIQFEFKPSTCDPTNDIVLSIIKNNTILTETKQTIMPYPTLSKQIITYHALFLTPLNKTDVIYTTFQNGSKFDITIIGNNSNLQIHNV